MLCVPIVEITEEKATSNSTINPLPNRCLKIYYAQTSYFNTPSAKKMKERFFF